MLDTFHISKKGKKKKNSNFSRWWINIILVFTIKLIFFFSLSKDAVKAPDFFLCVCSEVISLLLIKVWNVVKVPDNIMQPQIQNFFRGGWWDKGTGAWDENLGKISCFDIHIINMYKHKNPAKIYVI